MAGLSQGPVRVSKSSENDGEMFGPWMIAQHNNRRPRNPRGSNPRNQSDNHGYGTKKESERYQERNMTGSGNRFDAISDFMEEDS